MPATLHVEGMEPVIYKIVVRFRTYIPFTVMAIVFLPFGGWAQIQPRASEPPSVATRAARFVNPSDYVGIQRCAGCHRSHATQFTKTVHFPTTVTTEQTQTSSSAPISGCETCHGPGKAHADAMAASRGDEARIEAARKLIFAFNANPAENSGRCMQCHATSKDQSQFHRSEHSLRGVACQSCHEPHLVSNPGEEGTKPATETAQGKFFNAQKISTSSGDELRWLQNSLLRRTQPDLCFGCHTSVQAQFSLPVRHRVGEGFMKCTDCHNPHSSSNPSMLRKAGSETCVGCHVEKRGPFVFEHAAVKVEGCVACHMPHGTVNHSLLLRRESRLLCLQCHVDPSAPNVPHGRFGFTTRGECVRCHAVIHGSNFNEFFLQ
jgi:predicted CXXCH cytochrome family protein